MLCILIGGYVGTVMDKPLTASAEEWAASDYRHFPRIPLDSTYTGPTLPLSELDSVDLAGCEARKLTQTHGLRPDEAGTFHRTPYAVAA